MVLRVVMVSVLWAAPFVAFGIIRMIRAQWRGSLDRAGTGRIVIETLIGLWVIGGIGFYLVFNQPSAPDAGLAISVGLIMAGTGATIVYIVSGLIAWQVIRARS